MQKIHIALKPGQKIFFTSDLHIGHRNVINFCHRPFSDIKNMSEVLIANWNSVVGEDDIVFDLGDMFWWDSRHDTKKFVSKLNGTLYKVPGNHDGDCRKLFELCDPEKVKVLDDVNTIWISGVLPERPTFTVEIFISHCPQETWPHRGHGVVNLFGHIHSGPLSENEIDIPGKDIKLREGQQYDVGVDNNNFVPIEIHDIYKKLGRENFVWEKKI